jgi:hypothetical protein
VALVQERAAVVPAGRLVLQTDPEVRTLAEDVKTLSAHRLGDETEAAVQIQVAAAQSLTGAPAVARPDPLLGWYLRDMRNLTWVATPHLVPNAPPPLVVMVNGETFVGDESISYIGSDYDVEVYWQPGALSAAPVVTENNALAERWWPSVRAWWRWWVYGEVSVRPGTRTVTLWAPVGAAAAE